MDRFPIQFCALIFFRNNMWKVTVILLIDSGTKVAILEENLRSTETILGGEQDFTRYLSCQDLVYADKLLLFPSVLQVHHPPVKEMVRKSSALGTLRQWPVKISLVSGLDSNSNVSQVCQAPYEHSLSKIFEQAAEDDLRSSGDVVPRQRSLTCDFCCQIVELLICYVIVKFVSCKLLFYHCQNCALIWHSQAKTRISRSRPNVLLREIGDATIPSIPL